MKKILTMTALGLVLSCSNANASGFYLKEQSASAQGNAYAGATAAAEDISYSYFNPAILTRHKGTQINFGGTWISPRAKARNSSNGFGESTGYIDNVVQPAATPNLYISHQVDDRLTTAISLNVPYGMITKYDAQWPGRFHGTVSKVSSVTITPMAAYKVMDGLSIGGGLQIQYLKALLRNGVLAQNPYTGGIFEDQAKLKGDAIDIGYQLGALYELSPKTRFGLGYRSEVKQKLQGDIEFAGPLGMLGMDQDISARLTTPASATVGAYHELNDKWAVMAEYSRVFWSSFDKLDIHGVKGLRSITEENWKDTSFYAFGTNYKIDDQWKLRLGLAYEQRAVGEYYRTPRIPDSDRMWYSFGLEYKYNEKMTFNAGYSYIDADKAKVSLKGNHIGDNTRGALKVDYSNSVNIVAFSMNYNF